MLGELHAGWPTLDCALFTDRHPDPARLLPVTALTVQDHGGTLSAAAADGRRWPLADVFALLVGWAGLEALKRTSAGPHSPRITVDRLVVARETWRTTIW